MIRPNDFVEQRVANRHLLTRIVRGATVTYQGYHFPHMSENERPESEADWVGQFLDLGSYLELWRAYLSGQFYHLSANHADWGYRHMLSPFERVADDEPFMGVGYSLFRFTLALEFAARLAFTDMGGDDMHVAVNVGNLGKRRLVSDDPNRLHLRSEPTAGLDDFHFIRELSRAELGANPRGLALEGAKEFFAIFDAAFTEELLKGWQEQWLRR